MRDRTNKFFLTFFFLATMWGVWLRMSYFDWPIGMDEAYNYLSYSRGSFLTAIGKYNLPNNHMLNSLAMRAVRSFTGDSLWALRFPVFFAGLCAIPLAAWAWLRLIRKTSLERQGGWPIALATIAFVAVSYRLFHYSIEARGYLLQTCLFLLSLGFAITLIRDERRKPMIAFALVSALGLLSVVTHLYALASVALWMLLVSVLEKHEKIAVTLRTGMFTALFSTAAFLPAIVYTALFGTKIETAEPLSQLPQATVSRLIELWSYWCDDHSTLTMIWMAIGIAVTVFSWKKWRDGALLTLALIIGPLVIFILTKRAVPYARVWTYMLPVLFALGGHGWWQIVSRMKMNRLATFALAVPIAASAWQTQRRIGEALPIELAFSAQAAWQNVVRSLQPGDHLGIESPYYDQVRVAALLKPAPEFRPLMRRTDGTLVIIQQDGRSVQKADPFDGTRPGRVLLYALEERDIAAMKKWLTPYVPAGKRVVATAMREFGLKETKGFPRLFEFKLSD